MNQMTRCKRAVLLSGGLDSAVLLAEEAARGDVQPIYVSVGLAWEAAERADIARLLDSDALAAASGPSSRWPSTCATSIAAAHWAVDGRRRRYHTLTRMCTARPQHRPAQQGRRLLRDGPHRTAGSRHTRSQSVSGRDAGVPRGDGNGVVARSGARADDRGALREGRKS